MKKGKKLSKFMKFTAVLVFVIIICMMLQITPVADYVAKVTGKTTDAVKGIAKTVATVALGAILVTWGISALAVPLLGGAMILVGLAIIAWVVWPMFTKTTTTAAAGASFDSKQPLKIFA
jgi:hypothetical protein